MNSIEEFKEKVKEASSITEVVAETLTLKHGKALCPFHPENTPSFSVNEKGGYFHCFGCGKGGDVITYVMLRDQKTFMEAVVYLANRTGIPVPDFGIASKGEIEEARSVQDILGEAVAFYHRSMTPEARRYLKDRGFTEGTVDQFSLGYAGGGLREHLLSVKRFPGELCVKAGVLMEGDSGTLRDRFYKRVLFPNFSRGRVVNISGRTLDDSEPKYLHLPGRLDHLFNEDILLEHKTVFITEGAVDCLTLTQNGYPTVAVLGANNFKPEDAVKFSHCEEVFICLDGDKAGREGAVKIAGLLQDKARIVAMPEGEDINDFFKAHAREDFDQLVAGAKDLVTHLIDEVPAESSKTQLPRLLDSVLRLLAKMDKAKAEPYLAYVIKPRFGLKDPDIRGYRDMVNKYRGEITRKANNDDGKPLVFSAHCDGLIDVVEEDGKPMFLVKSGDDLEIMAEVETDARILIPPPREQLPWLLVNASEVKRAYEEEKNLSVAQA
ncbi:MAG: CHC2 zinc finger domain-containing protein, partial [Candidatus Omnitrophica bacterium]|nr:CHC2 zinc finger domain-containing protein [Candidatus Omnitrophota bacterium]